MKTERVNSLLAEIVSSQGFINIDQNDVDSFKANVGDIDAEKVSGKIEEIGVMLDNAISSIIERNDSKQVKGLLFVIRLPQDNCFMENINCLLYTSLCCKITGFSSSSQSRSYSYIAFIKCKIRKRVT